MKPFHLFLSLAIIAGSAFCLTAVPAAEAAEAAIVATETTTLSDNDAVSTNTWQIVDSGSRIYTDANGIPVTGEVTIDGQTYLFAPDGTQCTGWQTVNGIRCYFDPQTGAPRHGWIFDNGHYYYVQQDTGKCVGRLEHIPTPQCDYAGSKAFFLTDSYGALQIGFFTDESGNHYYADESGVVATGDTQINGVWYHFDENGVQSTGWVTIGTATYYFQPDTGTSMIGLLTIQGALYDLTTNGMQTGLQTISGKTYYFSPTTGAALTGWQTISGTTYYFSSANYGAVTGLQTISGSLYYFNSSSQLLKSSTVTINGQAYLANASGVLTAVAADKTLIMGTAQATAAQMIAYIKSVNPNVAQSVIDMIPYYLSEGAAEGVRGDIAFAQSCLETGNFTYVGSAVTLDQNNFCGMGVTSNGMKGNSFATPQLGIRAQIQHLKAYADTGALVQACIDPRFSYVTRGCAPYLQWLGIQENPSGRGWASGKQYGYSIQRILTAILMC